MGIRVNMLSSISTVIRILDDISVCKCELIIREATFAKIAHNIARFHKCLIVSLDLRVLRNELFEFQSYLGFHFRSSVS